MTRRIVILLLLTAWGASHARAQRDVGHDTVVVPQNRIDARDLGYPPVDVIPHGDSAITALTVAPNGNLYGATAGKHSYLFVLNPRHGYVQPLGSIPGTTAVINALVVGSSGEVYIGSSPGGHLLKYVPQDEDRQPIRITAPCAVQDMGVAAKGETIAALAIDRAAQKIYGLSAPNAHFFQYDLTSGAFSDAGVVARSKPEGEKFETSLTFSQALALDQAGNVYASGENGYLYEFDKAKQTLTRLPIQAPAIPGREPWTRVENFVRDAAGTIYGGTADGYLFRFDPEKKTVQNLGKPLVAPEIAALAIAGGKIYGVGGGEQDMARLFSYDPASGAYEILGFVDVNRRPYYAWQAYVIRSMATGLDGTIYLGESERISRLYLFYPVASNPAN